MQKFLKDHIRIISIIILFLILSIFVGIFITRVHKKSVEEIIQKHQFEKLLQIDNTLTNYNAFNNNRLLTAERITDVLIFKDKLFKISDSLTVFKEIKKGPSLSSEKIQVKQMYFKDSPVDNDFSFFNDITYSVNVFISLWEKTNGGFVKILSNEPGNDDLRVGFLNDSSEIVKLITKGNKPLERIYSQDDSKLQKSIPIYINGEVNAFIDIILYESLRSVIQRMKTEKNEQLLVFNESGEILFEKSTVDENQSVNSSEIQKLNLSKSKFKADRSLQGFNFYYSFSPSLGYYVASVLPESYINDKIGRDSFYIWIITFGAFILLVFVSIFIYIRLLNEKQLIVSDIYEIITESVSENVPENSKTNVAEALNQLKAYDFDIQDYTKALTDDDFESDFKIVSNKNKTVKYLKKLKEKLRISLENEEKRREEAELNVHLEKGRNEITDLLRYVTDINELSFNILKNTAKFLDIQQGGMFVLDNSDPNDLAMEMIASYAYDKKKYASKRIRLDEGLVGRAYLEREKIYMTEIPADYTLIESGFGNTEPKSLLIVPLIFNNDVQAVIELASVNEIEEYKIKFIESIGESIASTISNLKQTKQTEELLLQTQKQSREIEEQRKTLEEKINTHRKQNRNLDKEILQLIEIIESIKSITYMVEYDLKGFIMDVSRKTLDVLEAQRSDLISKHHKMLISDGEYDKTYEEFWTDLKNNKTQYLTEKVVFKGKEVVLSQSYVPIRNTRRKIYRILSVGSVIE